MQKLVDQGDLRAASLQALLSRPQNLYATLLVGRTLCYVSVVALTVTRFDWPWNAVATVVLALVLFAFGEALPKAWASHHLEQAALRLTGFMAVFRVILAPLLPLMMVLTAPAMRVWGGKFGPLGPRFTEDEIRSMVDLGEETGMLGEGETRLLQQALAFDDTPVSRVLTPRVDMTCASVDATLEEALANMIEEGYSRLPVYEDSLDHVVGIVTLKDLLLAKKAKPDGNSPIGYYMRPAYHVPENKPIDELLKEMQQKRIQMAIVSDEYGGTVGLVTLEDLMEEIVGEIRDEHDYDEQPMLIQVGDNSLMVDGRLGVDAVNHALKVTLPNNQTVGGLVFNTLGHVPTVGDQVQLGNISLTVEVVLGIRIQKVRVDKLLSPVAESPSLEEAPNP